MKPVQNALQLQKLGSLTNLLGKPTGFIYPKNTFYVIKSQDKVIGYCTYYLKPTLSLKGFEKQSIINSIAIDSNFRYKGFAKRLLKESIEEMKLNGISSILLYVDINNQPAIRLYGSIAKNLAILQNQ